MKGVGIVNSIFFCFNVFLCCVLIVEFFSLARFIRELGDICTEYRKRLLNNVQNDKAGTQTQWPT